MSVFWFLVITLIVAAIDNSIANKAFKEDTKMGLFLSATCILASMVSTFYLCFVLFTNYNVMSMFSSLYFVCIDFMLYCLLAFMILFTKHRPSDRMEKFLKLLRLWIMIDVVVLLVNPLKEIAVSYTLIEGEIGYRYLMKPLYYCHLLLTYVMVAMIIYHLVSKIKQVPKRYRHQYRLALGVVYLIVGINALYLLSQNYVNLGMLDVSIWGYSIGAFLFYYVGFNYSQNKMINEFRSLIFDNVSQGILLFDYDDTLVLNNTIANQILPKMKLEKGLELEDFILRMNIPMSWQNDQEDCTFQLFYNQKPIRCDYRPLKDGDEIIAKMYIFTDAATDSDLLTGFGNWNYFQNRLKREIDLSKQWQVTMFDINNLGNINLSMGQLAGDQLIINLANCIRRQFPRDTYFIRGTEANLITIQDKIGPKELRVVIDEVCRDFENHNKIGQSVKIQTAIATTNEMTLDLEKSVEEAQQALRVRKMLDKDSHHSQYLTSLIRALKESDADTELHVQRTQLMGAELGKMIGLTDIQQADLSLLCLLHDIGKIGIPLEVLNKPNKMTDAEWRLMQSHVEKGYQIAMSSNELRHIAPMVRSHHERWDGKGYPDGLSKESIPILSRIIAVVDTYDAMTNNRSYRKALNPVVAQNELLKGAGTQFDPSIVSSFITLLKEKNLFVTESFIDNEDEAQEEETREIIEELNKENLREIGETTITNLHVIDYSLYKLNSMNVIIEIDDNFSKITGYTKEDIQSRRMTQADLIPEEDRADYVITINETLAHNNGRAYIEHRIKKKDGEIIYVTCYGRQYYDSVNREMCSDILVFESSKSYGAQVLVEQERQINTARMER